MRISRVIPIISLLAFTACNTPHEPLIVATYNLRNANGPDSLQGDGWGWRLPEIASVVRFNGFDIWGAQEVLHRQLDDILQALPEYGYVGVGRDDGITGGEYSPIFFRKERFELVDSGHFWLSETPDRPGPGWDAVLPRICSWAKLNDRPNGRPLWFFTLHMDHVGELAQEMSSWLMLEKIGAMCGQDPVIVTGDFNVDQSSMAYSALSGSGIVMDTYGLARVRHFPNGTFNDFDIHKKTGSRIDHIFISPHFDVARYGVLTNVYWTEKAAPQADGPYPEDGIHMRDAQPRLPSDHYPVMVELTFRR